MFSMPVLLLAALLSVPALWSAFADGTMSIQTALIRFLIAVPVAAAMVYVFNALTHSYRRQSTRARLQQLARAQSEHGREQTTAP